jgi:hypothetical protein
MGERLLLRMLRERPTQATQFPLLLRAAVPEPSVRSAVAIKASHSRVPNWLGLFK